MEKFPVPSNTPENLQSEYTREVIKKEKEFPLIFGDKLRCFTRWAALSFAVGALFSGHQSSKEFIPGKTKPRTELGSEQQQNRERINDYFGEEINRRIEEADWRATEERQQPREKPQLDGFGTATSFDDYFEYSIFPKNWVAGEVAAIKYLDLLDIDKGFDKGAAGKFFKEENAIYLYPCAEEDAKKESPNFKMTTLYHELGHANDWEADMDLSFSQRQELILNVWERVSSQDRYDGPEVHYNFEEILKAGETYKDPDYKEVGYKTANYRAVNEYWAVICVPYFKDPVSFKESYPKDFELINDVVHIGDPDYDVFEEEERLRRRRS